MSHKDASTEKGVLSSCSTAEENFGPVKLLWCMRFEAKHQYFKRVAHIMCNFKNVSYTLSKRHQLRQCWEQNSGDFLKEEPEYTVLRNLKFAKLSFDTQEMVMTRLGVGLGDLRNDSVMLCSSLHLRSVKYEVSDFFVVDCVEAEEVPVFFRISHILNCRSLWLFSGRIYIPESFHDHLHAYIVKPLDRCFVFGPGEEIDHHALDGYIIGDDMYVSLHHRVHKIK